MLQFLGLHSCISLTVLPEGLGLLPALKILDLQNCRSLTALPEELRGLVPSLDLLLEDCPARLGWGNDAGGQDFAVNFCGEGGG